MTAVNTMLHSFNASSRRIPLLADAADLAVSVHVCLLDVRVILPAM